MGAAKFQAQLKTMGVETELDECRRIIDIYRKTNPHIVGLWREAQFALHLMADNINGTLGKPGVLEIIGKHKAVKLPSKLMMRYDELSAGDGDEFTYKTRKGQIKIYGGKVIENVCQAIARCIIGEQMTQQASPPYQIKSISSHQLHDEISGYLKKETQQHFLHAPEFKFYYIPDKLLLIPSAVWDDNLMKKLS